MFGGKDPDLVVTMETVTRLALQQDSSVRLDFDESRWGKDDKLVVRLNHEGSGFAPYRRNEGAFTVTLMEAIAAQTDPSRLKERVSAALQQLRAVDAAWRRPGSGLPA